MRLIKKNEKQRMRQGALEMNAYLIRQLSEGHLSCQSQDLNLLYLNLSTLIDSANLALQC